MSDNRQYELVYIVQPEATDQELSDLHGQIQTIVQRFNGTIERSEPWGRRKLAYEIGRYKEGTYVLEVLNGPGEMIKELDRRLKVTDNVIRHLVVRVDEEMRIVERRQTERKDERARRRQARGPRARPRRKIAVTFSRRRRNHER
jgi:small subunit ribosomal protein S6